MLNVLHFIRKNTQLKASFINNQINHHINYKPAIVFREQRTNPFDGGFAEFNLRGYTYLDLSDDEAWYEKMLFKTVKILSCRQVNKIIQFISDNKIDICHFHYGSDCGVFHPLMKHLGIQSVVSFYGYDCSSFPKRFFGLGKTFLKKRVFKYVTKVFAMSPDMKKDLIAAGCSEEKIIVHYYGTDVNKFFVKDRLYENKKKLKLLVLCSLVPQKGHLFLLQSLNHLLKEDKGLSFELRIVGTGELEKKLREYVQLEDIQEYIKFVGAIPYGGNDMFNEYRNADIFVHPSIVAPNGDKEGIPGTLVEAMSAGLPVISTYHAGIPYVIENEVTGILIKEWDVEGLANAIERLSNDVELRKRLGQNAQKYALENLNLFKKEKELESMYN